MTSKGRTLIYGIISCVCCIISYTDAFCGGNTIGDCALCDLQTSCSGVDPVSGSGDFSRGCYWGNSRCVPICECTECDGFSAADQCSGTGQNYCSCNLNPGTTGCCGMDFINGDLTAGSCTFRAGNCEATTTPVPTTATPTTASPTTTTPTTSSPAMATRSTINIQTTLLFDIATTTSSATDYSYSSDSDSDSASDQSDESDESDESDGGNSKKNRNRNRKRRRKSSSDSLEFDAALRKESDFLFQNTDVDHMHPTNMTLTLTLSGFTVVCLFGVFAIVNVCILAVYYSVSAKKCETDL